MYEAADGRIKALHNDPKGAFSTLYDEVKSYRPVTYTDSKNQPFNEGFFSDTLV